MKTPSFISTPLLTIIYTIYVIVVFIFIISCDSEKEEKIKFQEIDEKELSDYLSYQERSLLYSLDLYISADDFFYELSESLEDSIVKERVIADYIKTLKSRIDSALRNILRKDTIPMLYSDHNVRWDLAYCTIFIRSDLLKGDKIHLITPNREVDIVITINADTVRSFEMPFCCEGSFELYLSRKGKTYSY